MEFGPALSFGTTLRPSTARDSTVNRHHKRPLWPQSEPRTNPRSPVLLGTGLSLVLRDAIQSDTVQIILNHTDMARRPYATPYWRPGDPILYRTPAYQRSELYPFPPQSILPYEKIWGSACFVSDTPPTYKAGFIGTHSGPHGYRARVAQETAKVGVGVCQAERPYLKDEYNRLMAACQIIVCPRGWGEQSRRHWDAWLSGKPVLTDRDCDAVEMIPGVRLQEGVHYLVFDDPEQIPDIVAEWTQASRRDALAHIAENGRRAALSYDGCTRIIQFFERNVRTT